MFTNQLLILPSLVHVLWAPIIACGDSGNCIDLYIIKLGSFWHYNGNSGWLRISFALSSFYDSLVHDV
jgi:hypothetical protein